MSDRGVATRYAKSVLDLASEQGKLPQILSDMELISATGASSSELRAVLKSPVVNLDKKQAILIALFATKVDSLTMSFITIMVKKERTEILIPASREFVRLFNQKKKLTVAELTTAFPLSEALAGEIIAKIHAQYAGEIEVRTKVDPSIIGGFQLSIEDKRYDSSIKRKLADLKKELLNTNFLKIY